MYLVERSDTSSSVYLRAKFVIVKSHYKEVIVVIIRVRGEAKEECNNNDNLRVQWDLTGFYPIVFDVRHITQ